MPTPVVTLPKVASYIKNVGKSVKLASIDYLKDSAPNTAEFLETNDELFKEIYSATVNYKQTIAAAAKGIKNSKVYDAAMEGKKALFEDLKSGNWYNKAREESLGYKALDMGFDDMDFNFDESMFSFDADDDSDAARTSRSFDVSIEASTRAQADITIKAADYIAETVKASNTALFAQNERLMTQMSSGMGSIHAAVGQVSQFMEGPMMTHFQNTKTFQEKSMEHYQKVEAMFTEMLEMQRNLYKVEQEERKESPFARTFDYEGIPDLKEYAKVVAKNIKGYMGPEADMLFGDTFGKDSNPLLLLMASPLKFIPEAIVKTVIPTTIKKTAEQFDKSISGIFTTLVTRFNKWAEDGGGLKGILGELLKVDISTKEGVDTSKFKKGPIPFDGITKQAIVEVIPGHLRRIEAALTGSAERIYDMSSGKWTDIKALEKRYKDRQRGSIEWAFSDVRKDLDAYIAELKASKNYDEAAKYEEAIEKIMRKVYEDKGFFSPYRGITDSMIGDKDSAASYYDIDDDLYKKIISKLTGANASPEERSKRRTAMMHLAKEIMNSREGFTDYLRSIEDGYEGSMLNLFNGAYKVDLGINSKYDETKSINPFSNVLLNAVDDKRKNIFFYLQGIYGELVARRLNGGSSRGTSDYVNRNGILLPTNSLANRAYTPEEALAAVIGEERIESSGDIGDPTESVESIEDNWYIRERRKAIEEEEKKKGKSKFRQTGESYVNQMLKANSLWEKFKVTQANIQDILNKPTEAVTALLTTADTRVFELFFGNEAAMDAVDRELTPKGMVDLMVIKMQETFDNINDWLDEHVFDWLKKKLGVESLGDFFKLVGDKLGITDPLRNAKDWVKDKIRYSDVAQAIKNKFGYMGSEFAGSMSRTYGRAGSAVQNAVEEALATNRITPSEAAEILNSDDTEDEFGTYARGSRFITKRGLAVVSPGETIIPASFSKYGQGRQLAKEKAYARKFGIKTNNFFAAGTDSPSGAAQTVPAEDQRAVQSTFKRIMSEIDPGSGWIDMIANGLIGGGASLITGMIGGPLLGAAAGAGLSIVKQSKTAQAFLFGDELQQGIIPKPVQDFFKTHFPDMKDFGLAGAVAGLFTPLGLVGGLMTGGAIGYLKSNEKFMTRIFGSEEKDGLITKEFQKKAKKAAPRMLAGAIGGALLGPFGLMGNVAIGSALGFASTTEDFHKAIFGEKQQDGTRKGGIINALKIGFVDPMIKFGVDSTKSLSEWFEKKILDPLGRFVDPTKQMIANGIKDVFNTIKDHYKETVGTPIADFLHHNLLEPFGRLLKFVFKGPLALGKGIIQSPFQLLGFLGDNMTMSQIRKGTAYRMSAAQRVQWREAHPFRRMSPDRLLRNDKFGALDRILATQFQGEEGINNLKQMRDDLKIILNAKKEMGIRVATRVREAIEKISDFLNSETMVDPDDNMTKSVYSYVRKGAVERIRKLVLKGLLNEIKQELNIGRWRNVPADIKSRFIALLDVVIPPIAKAIQDKEESDRIEREARSRINSQTGGRIHSRTDMRRLLTNIDNEIDFKNDKDDIARQEEVAKSLNDKMEERIHRETSRLIDALNQIHHSISGRDLRNNDNERRTRRYLDEDDTEDEFDDEIFDDDDVDDEGNPPDNPPDNGDDLRTRRGRHGILRRYISRAIRNRYDRSIVGRTITDIAHTGRGFSEGRNLTGYSNREIMGVFTGKKSELLKAVNNGYKVIQTPDGKFAISTADGRLEGDAAREITAEEKAKLDREIALHESMKSMSKGIFSMATGFLGKGWEKGKEKVGSLLNRFGDFVDSNPIASFITSLAKGAVLMSMSGHLADLWTNSLWNPILKPFLVDTLWPTIQNLGDKVFDFIQDKFPKLADGLISIKDKVIGFFGGGINTVGDFVGKLGQTFVDGLYKFGDYILDPLGVMIWKIVNKKFKLDGGANDKNYEVVNQTITDENGNVTTQSYGVTTTTYDKGIKNLMSHGFKNLKVSKSVKAPNGQTYEYYEYYSGMIVIKNIDTGDFIRLPHGKNSTIVQAGFITDKNGKTTPGSIIGSSILFAAAGKVAGGLAAGAVTTAATTAATTAGMSATTAAAAGAAAGTVVPGVGTVIGMVVGLAAGLVVYNISQNKGYSVEEILDINSVTAKQAMAAMGWINGQWPNFAETPSAGIYEETSTNVNGPKVSSGGTLANVNMDSRGRPISGRGHVYQKSSALANKKFGNSTIGEAGCGPVAATNLINRLGGNMDINNAAHYAETGGFIDPSTGGTTTDYFSSILNRTGIGGRESTNKSDIYNSLKSGNPVVMLGRSGSDYNTPFGSNSHYINAMGTDGSGNIIAEDPDLPQSYVKYKANEVLRDMDAGIITGMGRKRRKGFGRRFFGLKRSGGDGSIRVPAWVTKAYSIIAANEGTYASVNKDDNGAMSVGRIQMHGNNARIILNEIFNALISSGEYTASGIISLVGQSLYNGVMNGADFSKRKATTSEANGLAILLNNDIAKSAQDIHFLNRIYGYYTNHAKDRGINDATQENVVIFFCDLCNQSPKAAIRVLKNSIASAGSASKVTLEIIYQVAISDETFRKYSARRSKVYQTLTSTTPAGNAMSSLSYDNVNAAMTKSDNEVSRIIGTISSALMNTMTQLYGSKLMGFLGYNNTTDAANAASIESGSYTYNGPAQEGQNKVVNMMGSKLGKLRYSRDWDKQNPDQGVASCASTVGWAYDKALGVTGMSANSTQSSKHTAFATIYTKSSPNQILDPSILQPGDVLYQNWDRGSLANNGKMQHTEMYAGNLQDLSHGGGKYGDEYGPTLKNLDNYRLSRTMMVRRYKGFMSGYGRSGMAAGRARAMSSNISGTDPTSYIATRGIPDDYSGYVSRAHASYNQGSISYEQFLGVIVELLTIIAKNSDNQVLILKTLEKNNIKIDPNDIKQAGTSRSARDKLKNQLRSGFGRHTQTSSVSNGSPEVNNDIQYIVSMMEALAKG